MPYEISKTDQCPASTPWGLIKAEGGALVSCHKTKELAEAAERAIYANENRTTWQRVRDAVVSAYKLLTEPAPYWVTPDEMEKICPACAAQMRARNVVRVNLAQKLPQTRAGNMASLESHLNNSCDEPGFFTCCMSDAVLADTGEDIRAAICARAHYDLWGYWPGEKRALSIDSVMQQIMGMLATEDDSDMIMSPFYGLYVENGILYCLFKYGGREYRSDLTIMGTDVIPGQPYEVETVHIPTVTRTIQMQDGRTRWLSVSATAVLNRDREIDSTRLFDSFIEYIERTGEYPYRSFYHIGEKWNSGQCDRVFRDGVCLVTSGLYNDSEQAQLEIAAIERNGGYWGESISFTPTEPATMWEVVPGWVVPVYQAGKLDEISLVPENKAAGWFTAINHVRRMEDTIMELKRGDPTFDALLELCNGDEEQARARGTEINGINERAAGMVSRATIPPTTDAPPPADSLAPPTETAPTSPPADSPAQPVEREFVLDDAALAAIAGQITGQFGEAIKPLAEQVAALQGTVTALQAQMAAGAQAEEQARAALETRLAQVERADGDKQREWLAALPHSEVTRVTYRPREERAVGGGKTITAAQIRANVGEKLTRVARQ